MSFMVFCAYTRNTLYEHYADKLRASLELLGLSGHLVAYESSGNWNDNLRMRYPLMRTFLKYNPEIDLLAVDADAVFCRYPKIMDALESDFAGYWHLDRQLCGGTQIYKNNDAAKHLLDVTCDEMARRDPDLIDQAVLQSVVESLEQQGKLNVQRLPAEYCRMQRCKQTCESDPVIVHLQANHRGRASRLIEATA